MDSRILVVNDEVDLLAACALVLESAGYAAETLSDGTKARERVEAFRPDVVLLDWVLGGTQGDIVLQDLRKHYGPSPRIIVMSALPDLRSRALELGADDFLQKPFDEDRLLSAIGAHTKARTMQTRTG